MKLRELFSYIIQHLKEAEIETPHIEAFLILTDVLNIPKEKIITDPDMQIDKNQLDKIVSIIEKRKLGIPLAYLLKKKEFFGIEFYIEEGVLVPRPETEIVVEEIIKRVKKNTDILGFEVGVGSGCIAVALLKHINNLRMIGIDISDKALEVSYINAKKHGVLDRLELKKVSIFDNPDFSVKLDFVVSNPPYISEDEYESLMKDVKFEPKEALISGKVGTEFYEKITQWAKKYLKEDGFVAYEVGIGQAEKVIEILNLNGFKSNIKVKDLQGIDRVVIGYNYGG